MSKVRAGGPTALSKRALSNFGPPAEVMPQGDARMDVLANTVVMYERKEDFVREIHGLWKRAQTTFLTIGKYLALAKARLPHGEYEMMIERDLPFSVITARQIRAAAEAVSSGRLVATNLPQNYSTLYQLSTLPDDALEQAKRIGLLRPDVRRSEIVAFKKNLAPTPPGKPPVTRQTRIAELRQRIADAEAEIALLEQQHD